MLEVEGRKDGVRRGSADAGSLWQDQFYLQEIR